MNKRTKDIFIVGFALFGSYFGAGNLIFPPLIGFLSGSQWSIAAFGFCISAVLMPVVGLYVISKNGGSLEDMTSDIHKNFAKFLLLFIMIFAACISVPRTGAVSYELGFKALFPNVSIVAFIIGYFAIALYFSLDIDRMINSVGKYLTPLLVILLIGIIIKGILTPIGVPVVPQQGGIFTHSLLEGYQTGDLIVSYLIGTVFIGDIVYRGYRTSKERNKLTAYCGVIALILLAVIYVGLIYLGASVSSYYPKDIDRSKLLLAIAERVLGKKGMSFLSAAVVLACVTTAIGQITSIANFFHDFSNGKIPHKVAAIVSAVLGATIAVLGVENIVYFATPIYKGVYPSLIVLMILGIFRKFIPNKQSFRYALIFTLVVSILEAILSVADIAIIKSFVDILPLSNLGFAWFLPATVGFILGAIIGKEPITQFD